MVTYTLVKFKNMTPLHIGTGKENYDFSSSDLHSDTLSAALAAIKMQMAEEHDLMSFLESFVVSSAFPFIEDRYFLPKPYGKINVEVVDADEYMVRKKLKKLRFVETSLWNKLIKGEKLTVRDWQLKGAFLLPSDFPEAKFIVPSKSQVNQRVSVPRENGMDAEPFFFEWTFFGVNSGLYCLLDASADKKEELFQLFERLGEEGIGTDRNLGGGKFEVESAELFIPEVDSADSTLLLSLFIPTEEELPLLNLEHSRYELLQRGGYMSGSQEIDFRHLWKKSVYMFKAGSVFCMTDSLKGKVVDLRPDWNDKRMHPVFRSGKPFVVPIKNTEL
ncbi:type III-A CRISPR-associated RAMP protein Csm4 [uncultured Parabacteroides sp.]|uniref:type III-A CRISPR-associated RAMP protein Csm4 n=1 Tax=uncultured Parabacteroides sp. TaxID=512312 RepID=UPI0025D850A0|nr:type III-A CRISPR-associated RAMP protein Csm4 [uncultured Parabacteroides sp.]